NLLHRVIKPNFRSSADPVSDGQLRTDQLCTLAHRTQTHAADLFARAPLRDPAAIVLYGKRNLCGSSYQRDLHLLRARVPHRVRHGFLRDPEDLRLDVRTQPHLSPGFEDDLGSAEPA